MTKEYIDKMEEIMDDTVIKISKKQRKQVEEFFLANDIEIDECYAYFLENHGNDYVNDEYWFDCKEKEGFGDDIYQTDMFFGLEEDTGNIVNESKRYEGIIPRDLFPIADLPGGDLVCIQKKGGKVCLWFHDVADKNIRIVADSFEEFIMRFERNTENKKNVEPISFSLDPEIDKLFREAAKKFQK